MYSHMIDAIIRAEGDDQTEQGEETKEGGESSEESK